MRTPPSKPRRLGWIAAAGLLLAALLALAAWLMWPGMGNGMRHDAPAATHTAATAASVPQTPVKGVQALDKPLWRDLTPAQQAALEPLRTEWDTIDGVRKKKWLALSRRFASMNPTEQARVHERMRQWMRLTPEQRNLARENFNKARTLAPGEKAATWESYKQLTPAEKQRLAQSARKNAPTVNAPPAANGIVAPTSCPAGTARRGASCISLSAPAAIPTAPAVTPPAPTPVAPPAATSPAAPAPTAQPTAAPAPSNANG
jgi:hypothetical protein